MAIVDDYAMPASRPSCAASVPRSRRRKRNRPRRPANRLGSIPCGPRSPASCCITGLLRKSPDEQERLANARQNVVRDAGERRRHTVIALTSPARAAAVTLGIEVVAVGLMGEYGVGKGSFPRALVVDGIALRITGR
jgi:hypothetical protein